jgi:poly(3-hydroxybutyrate) depolymerase
VPVIVFHGDRDHTVQACNGAHIVQQAAQAHSARSGQVGLSVTKQQGVAPGGREFTRSVYADVDGQGRVEHWTLHGAGHAWSGGDSRGTYTDPAGPDASAEMLRFFMALPR